MDLNVDTDEIASAGTSICSINGMLPSPFTTSLGSSGSSSVDSALSTAVSTMNTNILGAAAELLKHGQDAVQAARVLEQTDRNL